MSTVWKWESASRTYGNYGNANQWTVNAGLHSLARESTQNSNDARRNDDATLTYEFIRLTGERRREFEQAVGLKDGLYPHLESMGDASAGSVTASQIKGGMESMDSSDALLLLKISDYGCNGLTGPEYPEDDVDEDQFGNFIKLCRLDLFSGKDEAAGGSFGLGKAVYWRFSRLQTVLFNSVLSPEDAVDGQTRNRVLGVNQGVLHTFEGKRYVGRGYFGLEDAQGDVTSVWDPKNLDAMMLRRDDVRTGTTALMIGFYDPDSPERGLSGGDQLVSLANDLRGGIEESFWPLIARKRLRVRIRVDDDGEVLFDEEVDPRQTFTELVDALGKFDRSELDDELNEPFTTVVRDIPIPISARVDENPHDAFEHVAKLVVTISDSTEDDLENRVCLFRKPEMVVETIKREFEGKTYHAFLLAGAAINPANPSEDDFRADDFLRFSEPPAHDRWIPGTGRHKSSQTNLTARYRAPWNPNLASIELSILHALMELFDTTPPPDERGPEAIFKHLRFLSSEPGAGGSGASALRRPVAELTDWRVADGRWSVTFEISARNQEGGWVVRPDLKLIGLDGNGVTVPWESLEMISGGSVSEGMVSIPARSHGRKVTARIRGLSTVELPVPANESVVDVQIGHFVGGASSVKVDQA